MSRKTLSRGARIGICFKNEAKATMGALVLMAMFVASFGCGGSQQGPEEAENTSEPYTASASNPNIQQTSPQDIQGQASPERYENLAMGEPAEFKNGLIVTLEGASVMDVPESLREQLGPSYLLVPVRFRVENANPEGGRPLRSFRVTTAQWEAFDQNGNPLQTLYPSEMRMIAGELSNPSPDYPYTGWQGELGSEQQRQGSMLFAALPSTKMRVSFTQPVMSAPLGEWELGTVSRLPQAP
jgi:hypothetical protein